LKFVLEGKAHSRWSKGKLLKRLTLETGIASTVARICVNFWKRLTRRPKTH